MQSTHQEARRLIQFKADSGLDPVSEEKLHSHLATCAECRTYSDGIKETEILLRQTLRKQWNARPLPLHADLILGKLISRRGVSAILTTRTAIIGIASMLFAFVAWQSMATASSPSQNLPASVPFIPTPSVQHQFTATVTVQDGCREIPYIVREGDTLASIARQFSISTETLQAANHLTDDSVSPNQELVIPACRTTPTGTIQPPTITITPQLETISTIPG